jgi:hypothetical protein
LYENIEGGLGEPNILSSVKKLWKFGIFSAVEELVLGF